MQEIFLKIDRNLKKDWFEVEWMEKNIIKCASWLLRWKMMILIKAILYKLSTNRWAKKQRNKNYKNYPEWFIEANSTAQTLVLTSKLTIYFAIYFVTSSCKFLNK